jgi:transcription elongation factor GreA
MPPLAAHTSLNAELARLTHVERPAVLASVGEVTGDAADHADVLHLELELDQIDIRIERLKLRIAADMTKPVAVPAEGVVALGGLIDLDFGDGSPERAVVAEFPAPDSPVTTVTATSPLGKALLGVPLGTVVSYPTPRGVGKVRVLSAS